MELKEKYRSWEDYAKSLEARLEQIKNLMKEMPEYIFANDLTEWKDKLLVVLEGRVEASS